MWGAGGHDLRYSEEVKKGVPGQVDLGREKNFGGGGDSLWRSGRTQRRGIIGKKEQEPVLCPQRNSCRTSLVGQKRPKKESREKEDWKKEETGRIKRRQKFHYTWERGGANTKLEDNESGEEPLRRAGPVGKT